MTTATDLLKAPHYGIKDFKTHISKRIKSRQPIVLCEHGEPRKAVIDYGEYVGMLELMEELRDDKLFKLIHEGRKSIQKGGAEVDVLESFSKIRASRKL